MNESIFPIPKEPPTQYHTLIRKCPKDKQGEIKKSNSRRIHCDPFYENQEFIIEQAEHVMHDIIQLRITNNEMAKQIQIKESKLQQNELTFIEYQKLHETDQKKASHQERTVQLNQKLKQLQKELDQADQQYHFLNAYYSEKASEKLKLEISNQRCSIDQLSKAIEQDSLEHSTKRDADTINSLRKTQTQTKKRERKLSHLKYKIKRLEKENLRLQMQFNQATIPDLQHRKELRQKDADSYIKYYTNKPTPRPPPPKKRAPRRKAPIQAIGSSNDEIFDLTLQTKQERSNDEEKSNQTTVLTVDNAQGNASKEEQTSQNAIDNAQAKAIKEEQTNQNVIDNAQEEQGEVEYVEKDDEAHSRADLNDILSETLRDLEENAPEDSELEVAQMQKLMTQLLDTGKTAFETIAAEAIEEEDEVTKFNVPENTNQSKESDDFENDFESEQEDEEHNSTPDDQMQTQNTLYENDTQDEVQAGNEGDISEKDFESTDENEDQSNSFF